MTPQEKLQRAERVQALLDSPDMQAVFRDIRDELFDDWKRARTEQERESLHAVNRALDRVAAKLISWRDEATFIKRAA